MPGPYPTRQRLVELIRDRRGCTIGDLRRETGLSRSTLRQHLAYLIRAGAVQSTLTRRPTGRPPRLYRLTDTTDLALPDRYHTFLEALFASMHTQGREPVEASFQQMAQRLAAAHPEIRCQADLPARLDAARRLFFGRDVSAVERTDGVCQFSISACPLATQSMEFGDLCRVTRLVLSALVGHEVVQSEWIIRGDPRCTFEIHPAQSVKTA